MEGQGKAVEGRGEAVEGQSKSVEGQGQGRWKGQGQGQCKGQRTGSAKARGKRAAAHRNALVDHPLLGDRRQVVVDLRAAAGSVTVVGAVWFHGRVHRVAWAVWVCEGWPCSRVTRVV